MFAVHDPLVMRQDPLAFSLQEFFWANHKVILLVGASIVTITAILAFPPVGILKALTPVAASYLGRAIIILSLLSLGTIGYVIARHRIRASAIENRNPLEEIPDPGLAEAL